MSEEMGMIEKLNSQIEMDKEILSVMPRNNKKNLQAYKDKAREIKQMYMVFLDDILLEMKRRVLRIKSIEVDPKITNLTNEIENMDKIDLLNENTTSFEKMQLDKSLFVLKQFYKNNLELVNESIVECLKKFKKVGISLTAKDFNYSVYTKEYMKILLEDLKKGDINSTRVKDTFEHLYWKCSDIIIHIELNFRSLYLKNEKLINKYFENEKKKIEKEFDLEDKEIIEKYNYLQSQLMEEKSKDTALILEKFLKNECNPKDFEDANIKKCYKKLLGTDIDDMDAEQLQETNKNFFRLQNSLYEYKSYTKFKFIFDKVLEIYKNPEKYKAIYQQKRKQIQKMEAKLLKANKRMEKYENHKDILFKLFNKGTNRLEKINQDTNAQILELRNIYRDLEENKIKSIMTRVLNDSSTIYDVLLLSSQFYSFLVNAIIEEYPDILPNEIKELIASFKQFIRFPKITITNNVKMMEDKDIILMIKDKYNLCNINITKGDLAEENIQNLMTTVNIICQNNYLINSKLKLEDIQFVLQADRILEENLKQ